MKANKNRQRTRKKGRKVVQWDSKRYLHTVFVPDLSNPEGTIIAENPEDHSVAIIGTAAVTMCEYPINRGKFEQNRIPNEPSLTMPGLLIAPMDVVAEWDERGAFDPESTDRTAILCNRLIPRGTTMAAHIRTEKRRGFTIVDMRRP